MCVIALSQNMSQYWTISPGGNNGEWLSRIKTQIYIPPKVPLLGVECDRRCRIRNDTL